MTKDWRVLKGFNPGWTGFRHIPLRLAAKDFLECWYGGGRWNSLRVVRVVKRRGCDGNYLL